MKSVRALCAAGLGFLLIVLAVAQDKHQPSQTNGSPSIAAPLLMIESTTHDFGEVKAGTPLRYVFKIKNQGKADLLINNVAPS